MRNMKELIVTITGPTCSGKSTVVQYLQNAGVFYECRSVTTRLPRDGEVDGKHYDFVSREAFERLIAEKALVEQVEFLNHYYGLSVANLKEAQQSGKIPVSVVEPRGVEQIAQYALANQMEHIAIYLAVYPEVLLSRYLKYRYKRDEHEKHMERISNMLETAESWPKETGRFRGPQLSKFSEYVTSINADDSILGNALDVIGVLRTRRTTREKIMCIIDTQGLTLQAMDPTK